VVNWTLLTNDDGIDSPALLPFADELDGRGELRIVVPDHERSWVSKAITRFDPIDAGRQERGGREIRTTSGYPADGVQLAVHALFETAPGLVVSGINLGYNHGAAFLLSSGTVGAAMEARLSGVPAVAFSAGIMTGDYPAWRAHIRSPAAEDDWRRLAELCAGILDDVVVSGVLDLADVVSVNVPYVADVGTPRRVTSVARVGYDRLFRRTEDGRYAHDFGGAFLRFDPLDGSDVDAAHDDAVAITPVRLPEAVELPQGVRDALER
jgi:5'-nucleotidase